LPLPLDAIEVFAGFDEIRPDRLEHLPLGPADERAMHGAIVRERRRQVVPLAAAAEPKDDRVQRGTGVDARPAAGVRGIEPRQNRLDALPEGIGDLPEGGEGIIGAC
jgi:hypothetical protein